MKIYLCMMATFVGLSARAQTSCSGVSISPGQSIQAAVDANPSGTTFCIKAGTHRLQQVRPKDYDKFIGEPKTEMLFVNGNSKMWRVCSLSALGPGKWHFDTGAKRDEIE